jgi:hypothetical protein
MYKLRNFTDNDYMGFQEAESFPNGDLPLMGEITVESWPEDLSDMTNDDSIEGVLIILDANGFSLIGVDGQFNYDVQCESAEEAKAMFKDVISDTPEPVDASLLEDNGWEGSNFPND